MKGNRDKALAALLACSSVRAASEYSGISESTLWRYLKEPEFCTILDQRRAETMQRAAAALNEQLESATQTIQAIMQDNTAPPQTRVNAARAVLEYAAKYDEQANLLRRVERLEQQNELN